MRELLRQFPHLCTCPGHQDDQSLDMGGFERTDYERLRLKIECVLFGIGVGHSSRPEGALAEEADTGR